MSKEWHELRSKGIGGSDAPALFGYSPYSNNIDVWKDKALGIKREFKQTEVLERGHKVEPFIRELFAIDYPRYTVEFHENDHFVNSEYDFIRGSIDGRLIDTQTGQKGILEIKHVEIQNSMQREKWKNNNIPMNYFIQCLHYMLVTGWEFVMFKARIKNVYGDEITIKEICYRIDRESRLEEIEIIKTTEIKFWNDYVIPKKQPPLILPKI